jgi:hypothetical protein
MAYIVKMLTRTTISRDTLRENRQLYRAGQVTTIGISYEFEMFVWNDQVYWFISPTENRGKWTIRMDSEKTPEDELLQQSATAVVGEVIESERLIGYEF